MQMSKTETFIELIRAWKHDEAFGVAKCSSRIVEDSYGT